MSFFISFEHVSPNHGVQILMDSLGDESSEVSLDFDQESLSSKEKFDQSSSNDYKATCSTTPNRFSTKSEDKEAAESPKKKQLSGYLVQKHIKKKNSRNIFPEV